MRDERRVRAHARADVGAARHGLYAAFELENEQRRGHRIRGPAGARDQVIDAHRIMADRRQQIGGIVPAAGFGRRRVGLVGACGRACGGSR